MAIYRWRKSTVGWQSRITNLFTLNGDARTLFTSVTRPTQIAITDDGSTPAPSNGVYMLSRTTQKPVTLVLTGKFVAPQSPSNIMYTAVNANGDATLRSSEYDYTVSVSGYGTVKKYEAVQGPGTSQGYVYSNSSTAYPNGGVSGNYYYDQRTELSFSPVINVPPQVMQGNQITVSWAAVDGADGYILERKANTDSDWVQVYSGANLSFSETVGTWTSVQYRVKAGVSGTYGDYTTSASAPVVSAAAVVISGQDGDLGTLVNDVSYVVSSDGTNPLTVVETINGIARTFTAVNGATNQISVMDLPTGTWTIVIKASTNPGSGVVSVTRSWTYTKAAITFPDAGAVADLIQQGKTIWAKTIAEAIRTPGIWGGNLGLALSKLAGSVVYNRTQQPKYAEVTVSLANATVGQEINLPYNGVMTPHIVVHIGNPNPSLYDASCDGVWLLRKDIMENGQWNSSGVNTLAGSTIMTTMAGYVANYDSAVQTAIKTVKIPYVIGGGNWAVNSGANGLECKVFPLGVYEVGFTPSDNPYFPTNADGAKLAYFESGYGDEANSKRKANFDGAISRYWLRGPTTDTNQSVAFVAETGAGSGYLATAGYGIRPCFILPTTFTATYYVGSDGTVHDEQEYEEAGTFTDISGGAIPMVSIETGSYVGTGRSGSSNPNTLNFSINPQMLVIMDTAAYSVFSIMVNPWTEATKSNAGGSGMNVTVTWGETSVSWYSNDSSPSPSKQMNISGNRYYYIAIGLSGGAA